jgi:DNA-binding transcriptional ArsR family regulator
VPATVRSKSEIRLSFFELLFGVDVGYLCLATTDNRAPQTSFKQSFFEWPRESIKAENYILGVEGELNVYFCINLLSEMERRKKYCLPTDLVWADLDTVNPDAIDTIPPPIVVQSSPGRWQAFWRVSGKLEPYDAERYSRRIAYSVSADRSGWDLTQLFRVPMTHNFKYHPRADVILERALEARAPIELFEKALAAPPEEVELPTAPTDIVLEPDEIVAKYQSRLDMTRFLTLYSYAPEADEDWSKLLWSLEVECFKSGMEIEEVFVIAKNAACNKYERDGRPVEHLWREVQKASEAFGKMPAPRALLEMPHLVGEPASETFIDSYKDWACEVTDAIVEYHELAAMMVLSSVVSNSVRLKASHGIVVPNLWGLVLGDSTVTRKSTSMRMAMDLVSSMEKELILATDGSVEGLLTGLSNRPNRVSVFFRDEVSGLFNMINRRDYLNSMPEVLAHLYDVPQAYSRLLRKETIRIESPAFIFFGGGITDRVYSCISEEWIESGFMPRFLVVTGDFNWFEMRKFGPPTGTSEAKHAELAEHLADLYENYATEVTIKIGGEKMTMPPRIMAMPTEEAWERMGAIDLILSKAAHESMVGNIAHPTFNRLTHSIIKMAVILAASRQTPDPKTNEITLTEDDVINAAWYGQKWGRHSVDLILRSGKAQREKDLDKVLSKIADNPGVQKSTVMQHLHLSKREADDQLGTLEERGLIRKERSGRGWRFWAI